MPPRRRRGLQAGNSAIPGFTWQRPDTSANTPVAPGMAPQFPVEVLTPVEREKQPTRVHGLPINVAKRIHATLIDPTAPDMKDLYPAANRGARPMEEPKELVYNSDGSVKTDRFGRPVYKKIPYLGGDRLTGPYAPEFADPGPALWAARQAEAGARIETPANFVPPVNPRYSRRRIAGNGGFGPERGGVSGQTDL